MGITQMVAYNAEKRQFLRRVNHTWVVTNDPMSASGASKQTLEFAVDAIRRDHPGDWMIMRRQDALKIRPNTPVPVARPVVSVVHGAERSAGSQEILEIIGRLETVISPARQRQLEEQLSVYDKTISEMYHYIECNQLNAARGYKAYKNLRKVLLDRRKIKNELSIIQRLRAGNICDAETLQKMSTRMWSPDIDAMMDA